MKKLMAFVLSFGLVLLGTAPVLAAGQTFALSSSTKPATAVLPVNNIDKIDTGKVKGVDIPEPPDFGMLSDGELEEVEGEGAEGIIGGFFLAATWIKNMLDSDSTVGERIWGALEFLGGVAAMALSANPVTP